MGIERRLLALKSLFSGPCEKVTSDRRYRASSWGTSDSTVRCSTVTQGAHTENYPSIHEPAAAAVYENLSEDEAECLPATQPDHSWWSAEITLEQNTMTVGCSTFAPVPMPACSSAPDFEQWQDEMLEMPVARKKTVRREEASSIQFMIRSNDPALGQVGYNDTR